MGGGVLCMYLFFFATHHPPVITTCSWGYVGHFRPWTHTSDDSHHGFQIYSSRSCHVPRSLYLLMVTPNSHTELVLATGSASHRYIPGTDLITPRVVSVSTGKCISNTYLRTYVRYKKAGFVRSISYVRTDSAATAAEQ